MADPDAQSTLSDSGRPRLRICLAASGGGHLRQLLDLEPVWGEHDHFFLTEDTALSRSIAPRHRTHMIPHVALGQGRLGAPLKMIVAGVRNFVRSARIIGRERPDMVISTGAGAVFFGVVWARLLGARIVVVESFARFDSPSMFARLAAPFAHHKVVQSAGLASYWPDVVVFDPLRILDTPPPAKQPLLFATVGATLPFERLVDMVTELKATGDVPERVLVQTGLDATARPSVDTVETLSFEDMQATLEIADIVVCHGGTGSLIMALRHGCRVIAVPRLPSRGEHYDDHQSEITKAFEARGLIAVANSPEELRTALETVRGRPPRLASTEPAQLIAYLQAITATLSGKARPRATDLRERVA